MISFKKAIALFFILFVNITNGYSQWEQLKSPNIGTIYAFTDFTDPSGNQTILASCGAGIYKSIDVGNSWTKLNDFLIYTSYLKTITLSNGKTLILARDFNGIITSTDYGVNWIETTDTSFKKLDFISFVCSKDGGVSLLSMRNTGIFYSDNIGKTWKNISGNLNLNNPWNVQLSDDGHTFIAYNYFNGIFKSIDSGKTWTSINEPQFSNGIRGVYLSPDGLEIYAAISDLGLFKTNSTTIQWKQVDVGIANLNINCMAFEQNGSTIFIGANHLLMSSDKGLNWTDLTHKVINDDTPVGILFFPDKGLEKSIFFSTPSNGIIKYELKNKNFQILNNGIINASINDLFFSPNGKNLYAAVFPSSIYQSQNLGNTWAKTDSGIFGNNLESMTFTLDSKNLLVGNAKGVFTSNTDGKYWTQTNGIIKDKYINCMARIDASNIFAGTTGQGVYLSNDNGVNWQNISNGLETQYATAILPYAGGYTYLATLNNGIFYSSNSGKSWVKSNTGLKSLSIRTLAKFSNWTLAGTFDGLYKQETLNSTWVEIPTGFNNPSISNIASGFINSKNYLFIVDQNKGVFYSSDMGSTWKPLNENLTPRVPTALILSNDWKFLFAGTNADGIWKLPTSSLITDIHDIADENNELPNIIIKPNPMTDICNIEFNNNVYEYGEVTIENINGSTSMKIYSGILKNGINYLSWNSDHAAQGVYLISIKTNSHHLVKQILKIN